MRGDCGKLLVESGGYCVVIGEGFGVECDGLIWGGSGAFTGEGFEEVEEL